MRYLITLLAALLLAFPAFADHINTSARCRPGVTSCEIEADNSVAVANRKTGNVTFDLSDFADTADDDMAHARLLVNCTTTTTGAEDCDLSLQAAIAGALATRLTIDGDAEFSVTTNEFEIDGQATGSTALIFKDFDAADDDDNASITMNCTTATTGAEDCDVTIAAQVAGTPTDMLAIDADAEITLGSATTTNIVLTTDGAGLGLDTTGNALTLTSTTTATAIFIGADAAGESDTQLDTTGAGTITVGSADVTRILVPTDGGTVIIDGYVKSRRGPIVELASGALTINTIHLATAAADYDIPATACDAADDVGTWVAVIVRDISEAISITVDDASNIMHAPGVALDADDELDSSGAATGDGEHITLVCMAADNWYSTDSGGVWADGGGAD